LLPYIDVSLVVVEVLFDNVCDVVIAGLFELEVDDNGLTLLVDKSTEDLLIFEVFNGVDIPGDRLYEWDVPDRGVIVLD
jgi:hypothetical protein